MLYFRLSTLAVISVFIFIFPPLGAQEIPEMTKPVLLQYQLQKGEVLHAESLVHESVFINGLFSHDAVISESSVSIIRDVNDDGTAILDTSFRTEERINGLPAYLEWVSSENVRLTRDSRGRMVVPEDAARPVIRNIPFFSDSPVKPGDSWTAIAEEVHLFRISGVMHGPYRGEIPASYEYLEDVWSGDKKLAHILIKYNIYLPINTAGEPVRLVSGRSEQNLYWDAGEGRPVSKYEEFEFLMMMSNGTVQEFRGRQEVSYRSDMVLDRDEVTGSIRRNLDNSLGITVTPVDDGILLSLEVGEAILFDPESAAISTDQYHRLGVLKILLSDYPDRDILITGHTADFGTVEGRGRLSRERAKAVAGILFPDGRIGPGRLYVRGAGSDEPAVREGSEAGRSANRRVEILILD